MNMEHWYNTYQKKKPTVPTDKPNPLQTLATKNPGTQLAEALR
jgi:hypothetical protein